MFSGVDRTTEDRELDVDAADGWTDAEEDESIDDRTVDDDTQDDRVVLGLGVRIVDDGGRVENDRTLEDDRGEVQRPNPGWHLAPQYAGSDPQ